MNVTVPIALFGWIPVVVGLFTVLPPRRAVVTAFVGAWLFLPMAGYGIEGFPDYTKVSATCVGVLLAVMIFDSDRLLSFRPSLVDIPMIIWCLCPIASSISNDLGAYDGLSAALFHVIVWGIPYVIGRVYFWNRAGIRELAMGIFIGGLIYIPLCIYELRMSPQLHRMVYGFHQHSFRQHMRYGGYRPMVFMQHGLMVGLWMANAALIGMWLWLTGAVKRLWGIPIGWLVAALLVVTILCKSIGAIVLLALGAGAMLLTRWWRSLIPVLLLVAISPAYIVLRQTQVLDREELVSLARMVVDRDRARSLGGRLTQEDLFSEKAMERPIFGWGGWHRSFPTDEHGRDMTRGWDSLWVQALGRSGFVGLVSLTLAILLPAALFLRRFSARLWTRAAFAPAAALCMIVVLYMMDNLMNSMENPIFILAVGGISGCVAARAGRKVRARAPTRTPPPEREQAKHLTLQDILPRQSHRIDPSAGDIQT